MERPQDIPPCDSRVVESGIRGAVCTLGMNGSGVEHCAIQAPAPVALRLVCLCCMAWDIDLFVASAGILTRCCVYCVRFLDDL